MSEEFNVSIIFYKDDEIVGFGFGEFNFLSETKSMGIRRITPVADYDRYEVYYS